MTHLSPPTSARSSATSTRSCPRLSRLKPNMTDLSPSSLLSSLLHFARPTTHRPELLLRLPSFLPRFLRPPTSMSPLAPPRPRARHSLLVLLVAFACATVYFSLWLTPIGTESASAPLSGEEAEKGEGEGEGKEKRHAIVGLVEEGERRSVLCSRCG